MGPRPPRVFPYFRPWPTGARWGILGASAIARDAVAPAIRNSGNGVLAAIASRDGARGKAFRNPRVHPDLETALAHFRVVPEPTRAEPWILAHVARQDG